MVKILVIRKDSDIKDKSETGIGEVTRIFGSIPYHIAPEFTQISVIVEGMAGDNGDMALMCGASDTRIACTQWELTTEEIVK